MSETPTPEPLKPDTEEENAELRRQLKDTDRLIIDKNEKISEQLKEIQAQGKEIEKLESELASREKNKSSATTGKDLSEIKAGDLLNKLKGKCKNPKTTLADIDALLEILNQEI